MGTKQEQVVHSYLAALAAGDRDGAAAHYSDNATYSVNAWHHPIVGRDAIRADLERQAGHWSDFRYNIINIASSDDVVFMERIDTVFMFGKDITFHWVGVHEIDGNGKIRATRDYFDMKELEAQLT
jgi:limonene-1,2-epoxide hydrolase